MLVVPADYCIVLVVKILLIVLYCTVVLYVERSYCDTFYVSDQIGEKEKTSDCLFRFPSSLWSKAIKAAKSNMTNILLTVHRADIRQDKNDGIRRHKH